MSESFDQALSGIAASLRARLQEASEAGITHMPRPPKLEAQPSQLKQGVPVSDTSAAAVTQKTAEPKSGQAGQLKALQEESIGNCNRCKLHRARTSIVFGVGNPNADLVFVGEGPGAEEDRQGEPFVGKAGQLLTKMIGAMGLERSDVYLCNVVKCRPPNNRDPQPDEVAACEPFLQQQLSILSPKVIVTLGRYATQALLQESKPMGQLRGTWTTYRGVSVMPTFHPAYLLRSPLKKRDVWVDLQQVMSRLGLKSPPAIER